MQRPAARHGAALAHGVAEVDCFLYLINYRHHVGPVAGRVAQPPDFAADLLIFFRRQSLCAFPQAPKHAADCSFNFLALTELGR